MAAKKTFEDLLKLAEILRSENGCPWDREQTIASMLKHMDSEVHEVREAIENGDHDNLREELGDVIFQIIMIVQIAREHKYFEMGDVLNDIHEKIVSRHTWVFGDEKAQSPEHAIEMWTRNKEIERNKKKK